MAANTIQILVDNLAKLPGIGEKTAFRLALRMVQGPKSYMNDLAKSLLEVADKVALCDLCMDLTESSTCKRCTDHKRSRTLICVVASPADVVAIDKGGSFRGLFHVLHGLLSPLDGIGPEDLKIAELLDRISNEPEIEEVILATSANIEGESTAMYLARSLGKSELTISRIASGIPVGGELEYTDKATIARAMEGRTVISG